MSQMDPRTIPFAPIQLPEASSIFEDWSGQCQIEEAGRSGARRCSAQCPSCSATPASAAGIPSVTTVNTVNPKEIAATRDQKAPLDLLEYAADVEVAKALKTGAVKYGVQNYKNIGEILARVYGSAIKRHIGAWLNGQDLDPESGLPHLAHIGANVHVLFGAMEAGTFVDNRGPAPRTDEQNELSARSNQDHNK